MASLVGGMVAGADSIEDLGLLRHGGMEPGSDSVELADVAERERAQERPQRRRGIRPAEHRALAGLTGQTPLLGSAGSERAGPVLVDVDDTIVEVHGHAKQGAGFGYSKVRALNALLRP